MNWLRSRNTALIRAARTYVSPRCRPLTADEKYTREIAYLLKLGPVNAKATEAMDIAAHELASLLDNRPCLLIPVPNRFGKTEINLALAMRIQLIRTKARTVDVLTRTIPIESQCERHKKGLGPLFPYQHNIVRNKKFIELLPVFFVDNVSTSGNTIQACHNAMGLGEGLVFADAWQTLQKEAWRENSR